MSLKVKELMEIMEDYAPLKYKEDFDNVGLMVGDPEDEVKSILVALDCTLDVIEEAKEKECNFILTHHPLLFIKPKNITTRTLQGKKIIELIKNDINLYSSHTNLDSTIDGLNDLIVKLLGYDQWTIMEDKNPHGVGENKIGLGRIVDLNTPLTLEELCNKVKGTLGISTLKYSGKEDRIIKKLALINGSGNDFLYKAKDMGADCIITGDTTYHYASDLAEEDVCIIDIGHFESEWPTMKIVGNWLQNKINFNGYTNKVNISEKSVSPYKYI
ncbi:Nif3-like dinuclear metal center hexameric protein [Clostridium sp. MSJ-11]|uniref:Nif3-like dinuclear metal center hexameric protein n=1 Tax=Clostridium mobile TaxID=2841512 RepID=A0ABS6EE69_9CLOT|nr:Nif3-like dinuclear metal center hexameric protein [Clostridium mobile]MBU5483499.1 Nif3-like dinuclear metal center hexameric protein [Clostridium mobile]